jgi:glutamate dehydrogenase (NAD(P)+)
MAADATGDAAHGAAADPTTALDTARRQLERAATLVDVDAGIVERLKHPTRVQRVAVPLKRDDGSVEVYTGYRSQHDDVRGPYKGGLRFHPGVTEDECVGLSCIAEAKEARGLWP